MNSVDRPVVRSFSSGYAKDHQRSGVSSQTLNFPLVGLHVWVVKLSKRLCYSLQTDV